MSVEWNKTSGGYADRGFDHLRRPFVGSSYERRWPSIIDGKVVQVKVLENEIAFLGVPYVKAETTWGSGIAHFDLEGFYRDFRAIDNVVLFNASQN